MSLANLSIAFDRMRLERDGALEVLGESLKERSAMLDYMAAYFFEQHAGAETFLRLEAEQHLPELKARRAAGVAEA